MDPAKGVAHRTSPTNIGLYLACAVGAHRLGYITQEQLYTRLENTVATLENLPKWNGYLYNWYNTTQLQPLAPNYISTVDTGNFLACIVYVQNVLCSHKTARGNVLTQRLQALYNGIDLSLLFNFEKKLFHIGYDATSGRISPSYYDLYSSEAKLTSLIAIANGLPIEHWSILGRPLRKLDGDAVMLSWSGTMFEYLMPNLFVDEFGLSAVSNRTMVRAQRQAVRGKKIPWGISESGYNAFDIHMNYQYRAFGVPFTAMSSAKMRKVIAPYATVLALSVHPNAAMQNIQALINQKLMGKYGFFEAVDYESGKGDVVYSHMAHHQGMVLLSITNMLCANYVRAGFQTDRRIAPVLPLLQEKPVYGGFMPVTEQAVSVLAKAGDSGYVKKITPQEYPQMHFLGNGQYTVCLTDLGAGTSAYNQVALTKPGRLYREDKGVFFYIRNKNTLFSPTGYPAAPEQAHDLKITYAADYALWEMKTLHFETKMKVCVSPEYNAELRQLRILNISPNSRKLDVTAFCEPLLLREQEYTHPMFSNMFLKSQFVPEINGFIVQRTQRDTQKVCYMFCALSTMEAPVHYEADRIHFIGRSGTIANPDGIHRPLSNSCNLPLDTGLTLRSTCTLLPGAQTNLTFLMGYGATHEECLQTAKTLLAPSLQERTFALATAFSKVALEYYGISQREAALHHQLATRLLYPTQNAFVAKEQLWQLGISGDVPILCITVETQDELRTVQQQVRAYGYLKSRGVQYDLAILNCFGSDYRQTIQDKLRTIVQNSPYAHMLAQKGGIHIVDAMGAPAASVQALQKAARCVLHCKGSIAKQIEYSAQPFAPQKRRMMQTLPLPQKETPAFYNGYGGFTQNGLEYTITMAKNTTPMPWCNVITQKDFGVVISESGDGYTWRNNSQLGRITPWLNDAAAPLTGDIILECGGQQLCLLRPLPHCTVRHNLGYSVFECATADFSITTTVFADVDACRKIIKVVMRNTAVAQEKRISLQYYEMLGAENADCGQMGDALWAQCAQNRFVYMQATHPAVWYGTHAASVLGRASFLPHATTGDDSGGIAYPCLSIKTQETIAANKEITQYFVLGEVDYVEDIPAKPTAQQLQPVLFAVQNQWSSIVERLQVTTGEDAFDYLVNAWLPYQTISSRFWGRTGFYQSGGAYGFRDQLQDMVALLWTQPQWVRNHILKCCAHQFEEGDVQHWWHEPRTGVRTHITDDMLFLPFILSLYLEITDDWALLQEACPYLTAPVLQGAQHDVYATPNVTEYTEPVYQHAVKAIQRACQFGKHSLPLMGGGDWNDAMNKIGEDGGESVWLGWFLCETIRRFAPLCEQTGDTQTLKTLMQTREGVLANIEEHAWDGNWYMRAFYGDGTPVGSTASDECSIDLLTQAWAALSGGEKRRVQSGIRSAMQQLWDDEANVLKLLTPPFAHTHKNPGYIKSYLPGIRENNGQYTHAALWMVWALAHTGDFMAAKKLFDGLSPIAHSNTKQSADVYKTEPYVLAADVYAVEPHRGRGGWTWYTGSAAWAYYVALHALMGITIAHNRMSIQNTGVFSEFSIVYQHKNARYTIFVDCKNEPYAANKRVECVE